MAIDKKKIIQIEEGQTGRTVADNLHANFEMLADGVNEDNIVVNDTGQAPADTTKFWFDKSNKSKEQVVEEAPVDGKAYLRKDGKWLDLDANGGPNRALFEAAGAVFNEETGFYELNGLTDISSKEMHQIYAVSFGFKPILGGTVAGFFFRSGSYIRTNLCRYGAYGVSFYLSPGDVCSFNTTFRACSELVVARLSSDHDLSSYSSWCVSISNIYHMFFQCVKLKKVIGEISLRFCDDTSDAFDGCFALEEISIIGIKESISFKDSSLLNDMSILKMIKYSIAESPITITLHHDAYVRASANKDIQDELQSKQPNVSLADAGAIA